MAAHHDAAPFDMSALAVLAVAIFVLVGVPAGSLWLWSVWS
ncbi:hypothetical protein [Methylobacterium sp. CM6247]